MHVPPCSQGSEAHASTLVLHAAPEKEAAHVHLNSPGSTPGSLPDSAHVAPCWHGLLAHSSVSTVQFPPVKPRTQVQR